MPGLDDDEQPSRLLALLGRFAMGSEHATGEPDHVITMMRDIGDDGSGLGEASAGPPRRIRGRRVIADPALCARARLFLRKQPFLDRAPAIPGLATYACAGRPMSARLPARQCIGREAQRIGQPFAADPVRQEVQRLLCRLVIYVLHRSAPSHLPRSSGQGEPSRARWAEYRRKVELKRPSPFHPRFIGV